MSVKNCCFKGRGNIALVDYAKLIAQTAGLMLMGNAPALAINVTENVERIPDYTTSAGGTHCTIRTIESAQVQMTLTCHSTKLLGLSMYGDGTSGNVAAAAVVGEEHVAWPEALVPLDDVPDTSMAITVTGVAAENPPTYVLDTDYAITESGSIQILPGSSIPVPTVTAGEGVPNIKVGYQRAEQSRVQLFTRPSLPQAFHFDGVNVVNRLPVQFRLYRVKFGPAASVTVIGDNASRLELTGEIERDESVSLGSAANPFSQYGTLRI